MRRLVLAAATVAIALTGGVSPVTAAGQEPQAPAREGQQGATIRQRAADEARQRWREMDKDNSGTISREEWTGIPEVFDRADTNHDGVLTREELRGGMHRRRGARRMQRWFSRLDRDKSGTITRDEWSRRPETFDRFDRNNDGVLTREELRGR